MFSVVWQAFISSLPLGLLLFRRSTYNIAFFTFILFLPLTLQSKTKVEAQAFGILTLGFFWRLGLRALLLLAGWVWILGTVSFISVVLGLFLVLGSLWIWLFRWLSCGSLHSVFRHTTCAWLLTSHIYFLHRLTVQFDHSPSFHTLLHRLTVQFDHSLFSSITHLHSFLHRLTHLHSLLLSCVSWLIHHFCHNRFLIHLAAFMRLRLLSQNANLVPLVTLFIPLLRFL